LKFEKSQIEAKNEKIFVSIQSFCIDHLSVMHQYILSVKITPVLDLLRLPEASLRFYQSEGVQLRLSKE
jgi:hypothetical protein